MGRAIGANQDVQRPGSWMPSVSLRVLEFFGARPPVTRPFPNAEPGHERAAADPLPGAGLRVGNGPCGGGKPGAGIALLVASALVSKARYKSSVQNLRSG